MAMGVMVLVAMIVGVGMWRYHPQMLYYNICEVYRSSP
jgi:hypothetical protein